MIILLIQLGLTAEGRPRQVRNSMWNDPKVDPNRQAKFLIRTIVVVVTTVLIAMGTVAGISIKQSQDAAVKNLRADAANLAFALDEDVTHTLDSIAGAMQAVANRMAAKRSDMDLYTWAHQFPIISSPTVKAAVISPSGSLVAGTWARSLPRENLADQDYFRAPQERKTNGILIGRPVKSPGDGQILIPISKRVEASPGNLIGVLVFFVSPAKLTTLQSLNLGHNGTIALAGLDGVILAAFSSSTPDGLSGTASPTRCRGRFRRPRPSAGRRPRSEIVTFPRERYGFASWVLGRSRCRKRPRGGVFG